MGGKGGPCGGRPDATGIPFAIGCWTFDIMAIAAAAALSTRETYRTHLNDLVNPTRFRFPNRNTTDRKPESEQRRVPDAVGAGPAAGLIAPRGQFWPGASAVHAEAPERPTQGD
jgi:hypothetical protein